MPASQQPENDANQAMGKNMMMIAWVIAMALATWLFANWEEKQFNPNDSPNSYTSQQGIEVILQQNRYGHYLVSGEINNQQALFMLDTGASLVAVPGELQKKYNLISGQMHYTHTANGTAKAYSTTINELIIGDIVLNNVRASIVPNMQGKEILLGMSVLKNLDFNQTGDQLTLRQNH